MALRKASSYSKRKAVPYTRISKKKSKAYIKAVPQQKIIKFTMGNEKMLNEGKLPYRLIVVSTENVQLRYNAIEACRQFVNKKLDDELANQYFFRIFPFPHHIQRENKMLTAPGADRMQTGMQLSFGRAVGKAAILKPESKIFLVAVQNPKALAYVRHVMIQIKPKLPGKTRAITEIVNAPATR